MNNIVKKDNNTFISDKMVRNLHQTEDRVLELKDKLGISTDDKQEEDLTALQQLKKRFSTYINFNRNEFTTTCNYCGQMLLLRRRVKDFEALKHPAFSGRFLYNPEIIDDVKAGKITKEQASRYLRTSPDYITWCIENEQKIIEVENVAKENIDNFVNNNPNLRNAEDYKEK